MSFQESYGPWAVITGASAGIGAAFAEALAQRGLNLVLAARRTDRLEALGAQLTEKHGIETAVATIDLLQPDAVDQLDTAVGERNVGLLINNAGFGFNGRFADLEAERARSMIRLNCEAVAMLTQRWLPRLVARKRGGMVIVSSVAGIVPTPFMSLYGATKAFDLALGEGLAEEVRGTGVHVQTLCPGSTVSEFHELAGVPDPNEERRATAASVVEASLKNLGRRTVVVPGTNNKVMAIGSHFAPRSLVRRTSGRMLGRRVKD